MNPIREALALLSTLPDSSMSLIAWQRDETGELTRPLTREEIHDGLLSGDLDPETVRFGAWLNSSSAVAELAEMTAAARRQKTEAHMTKAAIHAVNSRIRRSSANGTPPW